MRHIDTCTHTALPLHAHSLVSRSNQVYGYGGVWSGAAQMAGDLLAAVVLLVTKLSSTRNTGDKKREPTYLNTLTSLPARITTLLAIHALMLASVASSTFFASMTGQIAMGSTFVFIEQYVQVAF